MALEYVNRRGDRYFVLEGKTKTGKPKYYCSKKPNGVPVDRLPEGFELREDPQSTQVTVRRTRPSRILPVERELLARLARQLVELERATVDVDGDALIVYASRSPVLRFTLADENNRTYGVDRWCFLGSIDDWFPLACGKPLEKLARQYLPHVGQESFFELM